MQKNENVEKCYNRNFGNYMWCSIPDLLVSKLFAVFSHNFEKMN